MLCVVSCAAIKSGLPLDVLSVVSVGMVRLAQFPVSAGHDVVAVERALGEQMPANAPHRARLARDVHAPRARWQLERTNALLQQRAGARRILSSMQPRDAGFACRLN